MPPAPRRARAPPPSSDFLSPSAAFAALPPASLALLPARRAAFAPGLSLRASRGRGRGLFAARAFPARAVLAREPALAWEPAAGAALACPLGRAALDAALLQAAPLALSPARAASRAPLSRAAAAAAALDANAHAVVLGADARGRGGAPARALFPVVALFNSACDANAAAAQDAAASAAAGVPVSVVRARRAIAAGEEVTVAYVDRAAPKRARRAALRAAYGFECACARCAAPFDDTVVLRCRACARGRVFWPDAGAAAACADCRAPRRAPLPAAAAPGAPLPRAGARALLRHAHLAPGDARVFRALERALGAAAAAAARGGAGAARAGELAEDIAEALEGAARVSGFASVGELAMGGGGEEEGGEEG